MRILARNQGKANGGGDMNVDEIIKSTLTPITPKIAAHTYTDDDPEYAVFSYYTTPSDYYDDKPDHEVYHISVKYVAPIGKNVLATRRSIKNALFDAGFTYPSETDISEGKYQVYIYECERLGETGL
jgi:protocatechuate 3,4-dioxygenase beta subunit